MNEPGDTNRSIVAGYGVIERGCRIEEEGVFGLSFALDMDRMNSNSSN